MTALCGGTHFNKVDGKIGIRGVFAVIRGSQVGYVAATDSANTTGAIAAAAFCLIEGLINQANGSFQRNLGDQSRHWEACVPD